jgi:hypothetical protein
VFIVFYQICSQFLFEIWQKRRFGQDKEEVKLQDGGKNKTGSKRVWEGGKKECFKLFGPDPDSLIHTSD